MQKCTKAYGGRDIRLVVQILLKRPAQAKKEDAVASSGFVLALGIEKSVEKKGKTVSERNPCLHSALCFPFRLYQEGRSITLCQTCAPGGGEKEAEGGLCTRHLLSSGADVASSTRRKSRKLFIPKHQLLTLSFQMSFISWFRNTSSPPAEEVWGTLPHLDTPQPCTLAPHANRGVTSSSGRGSWRLDAGGQQWGQCLRPPGATHS